MQKRIYLLLLIGLLLISNYNSLSFPSDDEISNDATTLTIATRHDSTTYQKFAQYFSSSDLGASVGITDPSQISFFTPSTYSSFETALTNSVIGASVAWGGGSQLFNQLSDNGILRPFDDNSLVDWISANISNTIGGSPMKHNTSTGDIDWVATAISSFGFTVNNQSLLNRGLSFPTSWADLASPEFFTSPTQKNVGMGNAPDTTSNTKIYQIILQSYGWNKGWEIISRMAGNSRIYGGSVETRTSVVTGEVAAALTIDFHGMIAMSQNPDTQYVFPEDGTTIDPDPIAISASASSFGQLTAARAFVKYVLSEEGQALWTDTRINRLPVRQDAFTAASALTSTDPYITPTNIDLLSNLYTKTLNAKSIIYNDSRNIQFEATMRYQFQATITNIHATLEYTWGELVTALKSATISSSRFDELMILYGAPASTRLEAQAINSQIISDSNFRLTQMATWETEATSNIDNVLSLLVSGSSVTFPSFELGDGFIDFNNGEFTANWYIQTSTFLDVNVSLGGIMVLEQLLTQDSWVNISLPPNFSDLKVTIFLTSIYETKNESLLGSSESGSIFVISPTSRLEVEESATTINLSWYVVVVSGVADVSISFGNGTIIFEAQLIQTSWVNYSLSDNFSAGMQFKVKLSANSSTFNETSEIQVNIIDSIPKITIQSNSDNTGFIWVAEDKSPRNYEIYRNNTLVEEGSWVSGIENFYNYSTDLEGTYLFTVIVYDEADNQNSTSLQIVFEPENEDVDSDSSVISQPSSSSTTPLDSTSPNSNISISPVLNIILTIVSLGIINQVVRYMRRFTTH